MNKIDIPARAVVVAPEFLAEIRERAWDGEVAAEHIGNLASAINMAMDSLAKETMPYHGATTQEIELAPITNMREWAVLSTLLGMIKDQARACGDLFEKVEFATAKVTRDHRSGVAGRQNVAEGAA